MTLRWPLVGSLVALVAGAGLAALVLAFCGEGEGGPTVARSPTRTPLSRTVTVTRTPKRGTPVTTGTPSGTPSTLTPPAKTATPSIGVPPEETPEATPPPPPGETETPGPEPTLAPGETPLPPSPTPPVGTLAPVPSTASPRPTSTPTSTSTPPPVLPDLVVLNIFVSNDRLAVILGNQGHGTVPAGQEIEFRVRGVMAETETLSQALPPGASVPVVLEDQVIYRSELVLAVADPNNVIPEEDDNNNGFAKQVGPDVALDLAVHGVFPAVGTSQLLVVIRNPTSAPAIQVTVVVTVYHGDATEPTTASTYQLSIEPLGFETVGVPGVAALPGVHLRVVVEMTDPPDADPSNNVWIGTIS